MGVRLSEQVRPDCEVSRWVYDRILLMEMRHDTELIKASKRGRCKDCKLYIKTEPYPPHCGNERVAEVPVHDEKQDSCGYSYDEGGVIEPEPNFGCIHFVHSDNLGKHE
jgi:hypothetical protein